MSGADTKYLRAAVVLMEERNFTRAARKLGLGQSALSKQMASLYELLGYELFVRSGRVMVPTAAGEIFAAEARIALEHADRAVRLSRGTNETLGLTLHVGKSPYTDPFLITNLLSLRLPYFPNLKVELTSRFAIGLLHDLLDATLDLAFLTGIPDTPRITAVTVSKQRLFAVMSEQDDLARSVEMSGEQLARRSCILFDRHVQPYLYDRVLELVKPATAPGNSIHHVTTAEEASQLNSRDLGVAIITQAGAWRIAREGLTIRPICVEGLTLETKLACRADNDSREVSELVRGFVRQLKPQTVKKQLQLGLVG